jgi:hypothetical protein
VKEVMKHTERDKSFKNSGFALLILLPHDAAHFIGSIFGITEVPRNDTPTD